VTFSNKYTLKIGPKKSLNKGEESPLFTYPEELRNIMIRIDSFELPGKAISTKEVKHYGPFKKIPYAMTYTDLEINIILSENMVERNLFSNWMNFIYNYDSSKLRYYDDYVAEIIITTFNQNNEETHKIKFIDAYPIEIGQVSYSYSNNEISKIPITFSYRKWLEIPVARNSKVKKTRDSLKKLQQKNTT
jgi:hypothetical protein